jgi:hypothetical protein
MGFSDPSATMSGLVLAGHSRSRRRRPGCWAGPRGAGHNGASLMSQKGKFDGAGRRATIRHQGFPG